MATKRIVKKPLSLKQLEQRMDKKGYITERVLIDLYELIENDMEWLNDEVSELITDNSGGLTDLSYKVVGSHPNNQIIIEVHAEVGTLIKEELTEGTI